MKIAIQSNAPWVASGYGVQTKYLVDGLQKAGHTVAMMSSFGLTGGIIEANDMKVYPLYRDGLGQDILPIHLKRFGADLLITLFDLWPYNHDFAASLKVPWAPWFPQDSYPAIPLVVERAKQSDYPIAMSKFGVESMREVGVECHYIPHCVPVDVYKPMDKKQAREDIGLPQDKFIVLMVAANQSFPSRKSFPECLTAFAEFHKSHPESLLYLHTTSKPRGKDGIGLDLDQITKALGIQDAVTFTNEYDVAIGVPDAGMVRIYNAADVLLHASMGEGFGVGAIEAQACGVPIITTRFSAMTELCFNGELVEPLQMSWDLRGSWMAVPSVAGITQALEKIYARTPEDSLIEAKHGRAAIMADYSIPVVMHHWRTFLEHVESGDKPSQERLYHYNIKGIEIDVWDDKLSFTTDCVASELEADTYGLEKIDFQPGDVVIDVGGHVGLFAIYVAKRWPGVKVYSFEPSEVNWLRCVRNLDIADKLHPRSIALERLAVTADGREVELALDRSNTGGTSEFIKPNGHLKHSADSITLDEIVGDMQIKLLKLDCEGAEHEILTTATCLDRIEHISGEFHINSYLESKGYSIAGLYKHCTQFLAPERVTYTSCQMGE